MRERQRESSRAEAGRDRQCLYERETETSCGANHNCSYFLNVSKLQYIGACPLVGHDDLKKVEF